MRLAYHHCLGLDATVLTGPMPPNGKGLGFGTSRVQPGPGSAVSLPHRVVSVAIPVPSAPRAHHGHSVTSPLLYLPQSPCRYWSPSDLRLNKRTFTGGRTVPSVTPQKWGHRLMAFRTVLSNHRWEYPHVRKAGHHSSLPYFSPQGSWGPSPWPSLSPWTQTLPGPEPPKAAPSDAQETHGPFATPLSRPGRFVGKMPTV